MVGGIMVEDDSLDLGAFGVAGVFTLGFIADHIYRRVHDRNRIKSKIIDQLNAL